MKVADESTCNILSWIIRLEQKLGFSLSATTPLFPFFFSPCFLSELHFFFYFLGTFLWYKNEDILSSTSKTLFSKQPLWRNCLICASGILLSLSGSSDCRGVHDKSSLAPFYPLSRRLPSNLFLGNHTVGVLVVLKLAAKKCIERKKVRRFLFFAAKFIIPPWLCSYHYYSGNTWAAQRPCPPPDPLATCTSCDSCWNSHNCLIQCFLSSLNFGRAFAFLMN